MAGRRSNGDAVNSMEWSELAYCAVMDRCIDGDSCKELKRAEETERDK